MSGNSALKGRARIAHELGVSERTATRWRKKGLISVKQPGGQTSAWRVVPDAIEQAKHRKKEDDER